MLDFLSFLLFFCLLATFDFLSFFCLPDLLRRFWGLSWSHGASARCLPDLIALSGFGVAPVDGIVMNILVIEDREIPSMTSRLQWTNLNLLLLSSQQA